MIRNIYAGLTEGDSAQEIERASECQQRDWDKKSIFTAYQYYLNFRFSCFLLLAKFFTISVLYKSQLCWLWIWCRASSTDKYSSRCWQKYESNNELLNRLFTHLFSPQTSYNSSWWNELSSSGLFYRLLQTCFQPKPLIIRLALCEYSYFERNTIASPNVSS